MGTPPLLFPCAHVAVLFYCSVQCCHNKASGGRAASWWVAPLAPNTADCMWATRLPLTYWLQAVRQRGGCNRHTLDRFQQVGARDQVPLSPPTHTSSQHTHRHTSTRKHNLLCQLRRELFCGSAPCKAKQPVAAALDSWGGVSTAVHRCCPAAAKCCTWPGVRFDSALNMLSVLGVMPGCALTLSEPCSLLPTTAAAAAAAAETGLCCRSGKLGDAPAAFGLQKAAETPAAASRVGLPVRLPPGLPAVLYLPTATRSLGSAPPVLLPAGGPPAEAWACAFCGDCVLRMCEGLPG